MKLRTILGSVLGKIPRPSPALGVALLALVIAASGAAIAAIPSADGTISACRDNRSGALRVIDAPNQTCNSSKETLLTWKNGITGKVANSELLDGKDSTDFLGANDKADDSAKLDGKDSSAYAKANLFGSAIQGHIGESSFDECVLGEVRLFAGVRAPSNWAKTEGQLRSINQNQALFSLLGTDYGGNGQVTFALPDLRGAEPKGAGPAAPFYAICVQGIYPA